jgi:septal ring factor EnvC (AmiA/AmiB activator)
MIKRIPILIFLLLTFSISPYAQKKKGVSRKARTTVVTKGKRQAPRTKRKSGKNTESIKGLQNQRKQIQQKIKEQERALKNNQQDVKAKLDNLMVINSEIEERLKSISVIQKDITSISGSISELQTELNALQIELDKRKQRYKKSMQYMYRNRSIQKQLMFIFSAKNFTQIYRRLRFVREYASYQKAQGQLVKSKQAEVTAKQNELMHVKGQKNVLLYKGVQEHKKLQGKQNEQQQVVSTLQQQQKTIQNVLAQQRRMDAALNAKIDQLIAQEVARAKARAAAAAQRQAAAEAARKRKAELAAKRAAAAAAARENARRIAEAKAEEERLKMAAREAAQRSAAEKAAAERAARDAEASRRAAEQKAHDDAANAAKDIAQTSKAAPEQMVMNTEDRRISGGFESNRGHLPMPITGSYRVVSHYGQYNVAGLKNVTLDNKGINIQGQPGAHARAIFNGEVSAVFGFGGTMVVMLRHGNYISVYCNLSSVCVHRGQQISTRQVLGTVGSDNILQFQLRRETVKLNPEAWIGG